MDTLLVSSVLVDGEFPEEVAAADSASSRSLFVNVIIVFCFIVQRN